jgi:cytochrome c biogenesis protein ResB
LNFSLLVRERVTWRRYLPHVMHTAFLIVLSGYLVSSVSGDRARSIPVFEGGLTRLAGTAYSMKVNAVFLKMSDRGYPVEFFADITLFKGTEVVSGGRVRVNHPIVHGGYGIYIKNVGVDGRGRRHVFFDAYRDDGAKVVLAGAVLFTLVNILYLPPSQKRCRR